MIGISWHKNIMNPGVIVLLSVLAVLAEGQHPVNRIVIKSSLDSSFGCWLTIRNTEQMLDFRTECPLGNTTDQPNRNSLMKFIPPKQAYLFKQQEASVRGYRYIKDPLNYFYKNYELEPYHIALSQLLLKLDLQNIKFSFEENYEIELQYLAEKDEWKLTSLMLKYHTPIDGIAAPKNYGIHQWLQKSDAAKSLAKRFLSGEGDSQPVNVTLELSASDADKVMNSSKCSVTIEEVIPEWFFISLDDLHTLDKFQVFDIELPAHFAKQYFFRYHVPFSKFKSHGQGRFSFRYIMKVRYPPPADDYTVLVGLHPNDRITISCSNDVRVEVEEDLLFDRGHKEMFAGKESDTQLATMGTYALSVVLVVWSLRRHKKAAEL